MNSTRQKEDEQAIERKKDLLWHAGQFLPRPKESLRKKLHSTRDALLPGAFVALGALSLAGILGGAIHYIGKQDPVFLEGTVERETPRGELSTTLEQYCAQYNVNKELLKAILRAYKDPKVPSTIVDEHYTALSRETGFLEERLREEPELFTLAAARRLSRVQEEMKHTPPAFDTPKLAIIAYWITNDNLSRKLFEDFSTYQRLELFGTSSGYAEGLLEGIKFQLAYEHQRRQQEGTNTPEELERFNHYITTLARRSEDMYVNEVALCITPRRVARLKLPHDCIKAVRSTLGVPADLLISEENTPEETHETTLHR